jgi:hypothetical protein
MRVIALLATYNEERHIGGCLEHLFRQGVEAYLIDNCSTDRTVGVAERYLGCGLIGIDTLPRDRVPTLGSQLERKEQLAATLEADWFIHLHSDERPLPPRSDRTLAEAFAQVDAQGYNAVSFLEFTFVPTREAPDHDHPDFQQTMRWYYPFTPCFPHLVRAWRQQGRVELNSNGGHQVSFPGLRRYPGSFRMRHYLFLSAEEAIRRHVRNVATEKDGGCSCLKPEMIKLPAQADLLPYVSDDLLDPSEPRRVHDVLPQPLRRPAAAELLNTWPIVVGGCHRSGTSVLRRILNAHSRIYCGPEVKFFLDFFSDYLDDPLKFARFPRTARSLLPESELLEVLGQAFVTLQERAAARAGKLRWADKNPENVLYLEQWQQLLGDGWLMIHVVRNPLDTLASIQERRWPKTFPGQLDERIALYKRYTLAGIEFGAARPAHYYRVVYEKLVGAPQATLHALMHWLGEVFEPDQLRFNEYFHQPGLEDPKIRETTEIHSASVGRWKTVLSANEARTIWRETREIWKLIDPAGQNGISVDELEEVLGQ